MKDGDIVRYKKKELYGPNGVWVWEQGLLISFNKVQRTCTILENKTGKVILKHCSDVQLAVVGHESR